MKQFSDLTPAEKRDLMAAAIHESAHAITARVLGHKVGRVTLTTDAARAGNCEVHQRFGGKPDPRVAYAGPWAEAMFRNGGGVPTSAAVRRSLASNGNDAKVITASGEPAPLKVPRLVTDCYGSIRALARELFVRGEINQDDVDTALRLPDHADDETREVALAMIRSGAAPGGEIIPAGTRVM